MNVFLLAAVFGMVMVAGFLVQMSKEQERRQALRQAQIRRHQRYIDDAELFLEDERLMLQLPDIKSYLTEYIVLHLEKMQKLAPGKASIFDQLENSKSEGGPASSSTASIQRIPKTETEAQKIVADIRYLSQFLNNQVKLGYLTKRRQESLSQQIKCYRVELLAEFEINDAFQAIIDARDMTAERLLRSAMMKLKEVEHDCEYAQRRLPFMEEVMVAYYEAKAAEAVAREQADQERQKDFYS